MVLGLVSIATLSQLALFDRPSHGDWLEGADLILAFGALRDLRHARHVLASRQRRHARSTGRTSAIACRPRASCARPRRWRSPCLAGAVYLLLRAPVTLHARRRRRTSIARSTCTRDSGGSTNPLMVATGDKSVFFDGDARVLPLSDDWSVPGRVLRSGRALAPSARAFLDALFDLAGELDRRPVFYQISLDWIPVLHDRGYDFFKLGEEAQIHLDRVTLEGHAGKMYRQFLRRAERDGVRFRIVAPDELAPLAARARRHLERLAAHRRTSRSGSSRSASSTTTT